jgi:hypothetical protein
MHNDSWITLLALFVVFVLLPQLTKFIKPRPPADDPAPEPLETIHKEYPEPLRRPPAPTEIVKPLRRETAGEEPASKPIKPRWF